MALPDPQRLAHAIRFLAIDAIVRAGEGHQGVPLGMAEIATALYTRHLNFNPAHPTWWDRDRVVLSNGHGSMLLYALNHLAGYERISLEAIKTFRELGSHGAGHPEFDPAAGIEVTTGPLGQGIANALGMALAEAFLNARFGDALVDHFTYAFVGDGCLQEGIGQETIALAGHLRLGKLVFLWDDNRITDDGATALSISEDAAARFRVAGWHVVEVDGHDIEAVSAALDAARRDQRPSLLACRTVIAKGLARLQGQRGGHSARLYAADAQAAREQLDWTHAPFEAPTASCNSNSSQHGIETTAVGNPCACRRARLHGQHHFRAGGQQRDTARAAFGLRQDVGAAAAGVVFAGLGTRVAHVGQDLVREHQAHRAAAMFERERPAFRSLDGIGRAHHQHVRHGAQAGEDLHRLVRRAVPADADRVVAEDELDRQAHQRGHAHRRAFVVGEGEVGHRQRDHAAVRRQAVGHRRHDVLAHAAVHVGAAAVARGESRQALLVRADWCAQVLGPDTVRVGIEAASSFGWERWLGQRGAFVGMTGFGASGPADAIYAHFGITADAIVARAIELHEGSA